MILSLLNVHACMEMAAEENSYNEDAFATHHHGQQGQNEVIFCSSCGSGIPSSITNSHERFSLYAAGTDGTRTATPRVTVSAEEIQLQSDLRRQRLQHQIYEENLEHLVKVKQLSYKLATTRDEAEETVSSTTIAEPPIVDLSFPLEVELTKKLQSQRIQHQIEMEEALHKLKMKQLAIK